MVKNHSITLPLVILLLSSLVFAAMPPETIKKLNAEAQEVLIGEVMEIQDAPDDWCAAEGVPEKGVCKYFLLRVNHVVKSKSGTTEGSLVKVRFVEYVTPIRGPRLVRVDSGKLMIIYANAADFDKDVLIPAAAGDSVITIGRPAE